jgi:16S rRNA (guanine527-N7)-methyltransferase
MGSRQNGRDILREGILRLGEMSQNNAGAPSLFANLDYILDRLERYIAEIELFNGVYKLVGTRDREELIVKHILDSLSGTGVISRYADSCRGTLSRDAGVRIADAGSGAGLPGIPLAIALPGHHFTLIERMGRRAGFLSNTLAVLGLSNIDVEEKEVEKTAPNRYNIVTFRAYTPLGKDSLKSLFRLLLPNGVLIAYKGKKNTVEQELSPLSAQLTAAGWELLPISVPFLDEERHIAVIPHYGE